MIKDSLWTDDLIQIEVFGKGTPMVLEFQGTSPIVYPIKLMAFDNYTTLSMMPFMDFNH